MAWYTNNSGYGTPFGWGDDRERSGHYTSTSQQHTPASGHSSRGGWQGTGPSHTAAGFAPAMNSWPNNAVPGHSVSAYGGNGWPSASHHDQTRSESWSGAPGSSAAGSSELDQFLGMNFGEPAFPAAPTPLHAPQHFSAPPSSWPQAPGQPWQSAPSGSHPVHAARQRGDHGNPVGSLGPRPDVPSYHMAATPSSTARHSERRSLQAGHSHSTASRSSVQPSTHGPASPEPPFQPRGEWWDPPDAARFPCQWTTTTTRGIRPCSALIAGDRRSVTSHLREQHGFTADGETIVCAWGGCTTGSMQRRNLPRHIVSFHMAIKVPCPGCGMLLSRADANKKHRQACPAAGAARVRSPASEEDEGGFY